MNNIIMGNGVNINFDNNKERWKDFIIDCQTNFLIILDKASKHSNPQIKSISNVWDVIKQWIDFDKESYSLENMMRFFNFIYYKDCFETESAYVVFLQKIWKLTMTPFTELYPVEIPYTFDSPTSLFGVNMHLSMIGEMYKKAIEITLFDEYKVHDITVPSKFKEFIRNNYDQIISLNYDDNMEPLSGVVKIHGSYNVNMINYNNKIEKNTFYEEFVSFVKVNTLKWDMILEKNSKVKKQNLDLLNEWSYEGLAPTFESLNVSNDNIDINKLRINNVSTYHKFSQLKGIVEIIGISPANDDAIFNALLKNNNITKIIYYGNEIIKMDKKIEQKHYSEFWDKAL